MWLAIAGPSLIAGGCGAGSQSSKTVAIVGHTPITEGDLNQARAASQVVQGVRLDDAPAVTKSQVTALAQQQAVIAWALNHGVITRSAASHVAHQVIQKQIAPQAGGTAALSRRLSQNGLTMSQFQAYVSQQMILQAAFQRVTGKVSMPTTADAYSYYLKNKAFYVSPPEDLVRDIRVKTHAEATGILAQLKHGANFAALAARDSQDQYKRQGGSRGWVQLGASSALPKTWLNTVMSLKPGQMSIVKGPLGYSIIEVQASRAGAAIPFSAVEPAIKAEMVQSAKEKAFDTWAAGLMNSEKVRLFVS
nr:peptidylprolyl isomerase [Sulfobacillus harzensis]